MNSHPADPNSEHASPPGHAAQEVLEGDRPSPPSESASEPLAKDNAAPDAVLFSLREQLQELRQRFDRADAQLAGYLREQAGTNRGSAGNGEAMAHVQHSLDRLLSQFEAMAPALTAPRDAGPTPTQTSSQEAASSSHQDILEAVKELADLQNHLAGKIVNTVGKRLTEELDLLRFQQIVHETLSTEWDRREAQAKRQAEEDALALAQSESEIERQDGESEKETPPEEDPSAQAWSRAIWGPELVESEGFVPFLSELNRRLLAGDPGIANLAGQLLVFRQSPPEAKPQLLKDVGEAYYRTRLDAALPDHPFERAIIDWLQGECERVGLPNTIEVVHVGERFDKSRHSSTTRGGAEVAEVFGWVVLTEGGRVYTRASVAAQ